MEARLNALFSSEKATEQEILSVVEAGRRKPDALLSSLAQRFEAHPQRAVDALVLWVKLHKADILENSGRLQKALGILNTRSKDLSDVCRRLCNILTGPHDPFSCLTSLEFAEYLTVRDVDSLAKLCVRPGDNLLHVAAPHTLLHEQFGLWIASMILSNDSARLQAQKIEFFIQTMARLIIMRNYNSLVAIYSGLNLPSVKRLRAAWSRVHVKEQSNLATVDSLLSPTDDNFQYRKILARETQSQTIPVIPIITMLLASEDILIETPASTPASKRRTNTITQSVLEVIARIEMFQRLSSLFPVRQTDPEVFAFISSFADTKTAEELWDISSRLQTILTDEEITRRMELINMHSRKEGGDGGGNDDDESSESLLSSESSASTSSLSHDRTFSYGSTFNVGSDDATELFLDDLSDDEDDLSFRDDNDGSNSSNSNEEAKDKPKIKRPRSKTSLSSSSSSSSGNPSLKKKSKGTASFLISILGSSKETKRASVSMGLYGSPVTTKTSTFVPSSSSSSGSSGSSSSLSSSSMEVDAKGYVYACRFDKIPSNKGFALKINKKQVAIFKTSDGSLFAINNICSHAGVPLVSLTALSDIEEYKGKACIKCPGHGVRFNIADGSTSTKKYFQKSFPVKRKGDEIWIKL